ncbi:DUF2304 domain-containing protein [Arthrobacter sp. B2a2-09]|uniref:DUF2304 domain-containing protein n=1 Tax=Arthrobacter sp. B2a2-09 TaxID=2952822 RepID=UPI0022CD6E95|nr:DUF2304 domain-containing protein [Arthrobacter sp. B2a2-09]MCZ9880983.1 DUF2304 domain-containing protein [Arthrobacter sp. B2a2-09]
MSNLAAFLVALVIVALVVEMLRRKKLREKYAALWLLVGGATLILAAFPRLLNIVAELVGVQLPSNLLFAMSILLLLGVCLHLSWEISVVEDETRALAEEVAILRTQLESLAQGKSSRHAGTRTAETEAESQATDPLRNSTESSDA